MKKGDGAGIIRVKKERNLVEVKPEIFKLFFKDAPELRHIKDITTITGEVVREVLENNEVVVEFPGLGTRNLSRNDVKFVWQFLAFCLWRESSFR